MKSTPLSILSSTAGFTLGWRIFLLTGCEGGKKMTFRLQFGLYQGHPIPKKYTVKRRRFAPFVLVGDS